VRDEFRHMVRRLHAAGIEVILDVVFNHTAETDEFGPTLSWRGLDNASYYRLVEGHAATYENHAGCGNTLDLRQPRVLQLVMDSLRYWVREFHVDGFRFDLATVLGRGSTGFERNGPFFACVTQDPVLAGVKLIAEPWDIGPGGYQLGQFPTGWLEWNDRFRDTMRLVAGRDCTRGEFARRLCGVGCVPAARAPRLFVNHRRTTATLRDCSALSGATTAWRNNRDGHGHNLTGTAGRPV
jgi:glycogen operon protein